MDDTYESWYEQSGSSTPQAWGQFREIGYFLDNNNWMNARCVSFYHWAYSNLPTEATVTSVRIRFRAYGMAPNNFQFALNNINHNSGDNNFDYYDAFTPSDQLYTESIAPSSDGYAYFDMTFTSGPVVTAVNSAVQSGQNFLAIGIQVVGSSIPDAVDEIDDYSGNGDQSSPGVELTIGYTTPIQNFQLANEIEGTDNYGSLTIRDNTKNTTSSVSSGTVVGLTLNDTCISTTNELPFEAVWNGGSYTEKHAYWYVNPSSNYVLNYNFIANVDHTSSSLIAEFNRTSPVTIETMVNGSVGSGNVSLEDPWYYYQDANGNWQQSDQFKSYSSPFAIQNNNSTSYGGAFLNMLFGGSTPFYSVSVPSVQTVNGYAAFFAGWTCSPSGSASFQSASSPTTAVVFNSSGATIIANYSYSTVTYNATVSSGSWPMAGSVTVPSGVTLTGSSGATLNFPSGSSLTINGALSGGGMGLAASSGTWTGVVVNTSGASVSNCTISEANLPLNISGASSATISSVTINNSNFSRREAVSVSNSSPTISGLTIDGQSGSANGVAYTNSSGGTLSNSIIQTLGLGQGVTVQGNSSPTISGNTIEHNYYHGIACWSDGTGSPNIESNTLEYNGSDGLMMDQSAAYLLNDQSSDNNVGIYCENGSIISTGGESQAGGNTITDNTDGIGATENSTVSFGDYTGRFYDGTCNSIYGNITYNAYASNTSYITAEYDWWGQSPPDASKFWTDNSSSTIDYTGALSSQANCPISGLTAQEVTLSGKTISGGTTPSGNDPTSLFQFARQAREDGQYGLATAAYRVLLKDSISSALKERALFRLFNDFQLSRDSTIIGDLQTCSKSLGELGLRGQELLGYAYEATKQTSKAESILNNIVTAHPGTEFEKDALILLASMRDFDTSATAVSSEALNQLVLKYGTSVDKGLLLSLGAKLTSQPLAPASSQAAAANVDSISALTGTLLENYPNPFNPTTEISFQLPRNGQVTLKVYDVLGRLVSTLVDGYQSAGVHTAQFNGDNLASGVYLYRLTAPGTDQVKKMILLK